MPVRTADGLINELWWVGILQGVLAVFFGITALFWPGLTLVNLVYLFSGFVLGLGIIEIMHGIMSIRRRNTWWVTLLVGLIGLGVGVYLLRHPGVSFDTFILVIGIGLIARGVLDAVRSFVDRTPAVNRALSAVLGIAAIAAGILILLQPVGGGVAFVWILGLYALIYGTFTLALAFEMRSAFEEGLLDGTRGESNGSRRQTARVREA
jgi:uncharacterized membrane protein HdeD (DUF308 family)